MERELSPQEKALVERELVARHEIAERRRAFAHRVFTVGIAAGLLYAALRAFHFQTLISPLSALAWLICVVTYVGLGAFPSSFAKDMDLRWHLNPWQEALAHLGEGRTHIGAIALLAAPFLGRIVFSVIYLGFK